MCLVFCKKNLRFGILLKTETKIYHLTRVSTQTNIKLETGLLFSRVSVTLKELGKR